MASAAKTQKRRTGTGEIVPRRYELEAGQREFYAALWELVPEAMEPLYHIDWLLSLDFESKWESVVWMLGRWHENYRLTELRGRAPLHYLPDVGPLPFSERPASVYEGRDRRDEVDAQNGITVKPRRQSKYVMRNGMIRDSDSYAVFLAHLLYDDPDGGTEWPGDAEIGDFDPRAETVDQAIGRMLPQLETRLRYALQGIVEQDAAIGQGVPVRRLPPRQHFEWTVRYQVLGESYGRIAESDGIRNSRTVSEAVRFVASLIMLTLREPDKGGRPRKKAPTRSTRCIAIPHAFKTPVSLSEYSE